MAISYEPELLLARDQGLKLVSIGALVQRPLTSIIALPEQARRERGADLAGKTRRHRRHPLPGGRAAHGAAARRRRPRVGEGSQRRLQPRAGDALGTGRRDARRLLELRGDPAAPDAQAPRRDPGRPGRRAELRRARAGRARRARRARDGQDLRAFMQALTRGERAVRADPAAAAHAARRRPTRRWNPSCSSNRSARRCRRPRRPTRASPTAGRTRPRGRRSASWMFAHGLLSHDPDAGGLPPFTNEFLPGARDLGR